MHWIKRACLEKVLIFDSQRESYLIVNHCVYRAQIVGQGSMRKSAAVTPFGLIVNNKWRFSRWNFSGKTSDFLKLGNI